MIKTIKLSACKIGILVKTCGTDDKKIGHVTGLAKNSTGEVIPVVLWAGEVVPVAIHCSNIVEYKD